MFRFAFGKRGGLFEFQAAFFTVAPQQPSHRFGVRGKIRQCLLDRHRELYKLLAVLVVRRPLLRLLPQLFNGIVIRGIRRQGMVGDPIAMGRQKCLGRGARVITGTIVNQKQMLSGWLHNPLQEGWVIV
jgi:hypothetical protein